MPKVNTICVDIVQHALDIQQANQFVCAAHNGAINLFLGQVRDHNLGRSVQAVSYDVFAPLAKNIFYQLCSEAIDLFDQRLRCFIQHYQGRLSIGQSSVLIATGAPHRDAAYKACRYLIEQIKIRAPIWKQEHYFDGDSEWVRGHALCQR